MLKFLRRRIKSIIFKKNFKIIILLLILIVASFLRLYKIDQYLIFLGDEGRDSLIVKRMIVDHKFTLLGPTASVGGFYLGPIYYYMMIIPTILANFEPVGPAIMVALFGVITVFLIFIFLNQIWGPIPAIFAALLYSFSPVVLEFSRFSWNPNSVPLFSLLLIWFLYQGSVSKMTRHFFLAGCCLGIALQLHYLTLILGPVTIASILLTNNPRKSLKAIAFSFLGTLFTFSPFLAFEARHQFPNTKSLLEFITRSHGPIHGRHLNILFDFTQKSSLLFQETLNLNNLYFIVPLIIISLLLLINFLFKTKEKAIKKGTFIIFLWWILGVGVLCFYRGRIIPHYLTYLFPLSTIIVGFLLWRIFQTIKIFGKLLSILLLLSILFLQIKGLYLWYSPNNQVKQTKEISKTILNLTNSEPYNFALVSSGNSDHAYRYFLELWGKPPKTLEEEITGQLIVICEETCDILGHPLWEIAGFGRAEIKEVIEGPVGIKIYKLIHHQESLNLIGQPVIKGK
jgi:4-amino-4-deoxy-L-arabinose transferase-like glycosyltransferase